jgi:hypothetical protein
MVVFLGKTNLGAIADSKRLKLSMKGKVPGMMVTEMEKQSAHGKGAPYADI